VKWLELFQLREAAVGNALSPTVDSREIFRRQVMQAAVDEDRQFVLDTLFPVLTVA